jgi:hypothetical protein
MSVHSGVDYSDSSFGMVSTGKEWAVSASPNTRPLAISIGLLPKLATGTRKGLFFPGTSTTEFFASTESHDNAWGG